MRLSVVLLTTITLALAATCLASGRTQAGPKYGGTLVVGQAPAALPSLDPTVGSTLTIYRHFCERLYERDTTQQVVPVLAAALPVLSKDKLSYTVQLRKGIQFNDGTPFNAQAVVTTVQRFITYPGSVRANDFAGVDSVTASGPYTVVYHLKARDSTFTASSYVLSPTQLARLGDNFATNPVCVGPFMFDNQVAGDHVTLIKSPYYYDQKNVYLDKLVFRQVADTSALTTALKAGDVQVLTPVSTTELDGVRRTSSLRVIQGYQLAWQGIIINIGNRSGLGKLPYSKVGSPLASSAKLRQAFEEAIDRNTLNKVVFDGLVQVSCTPIAPSNTLWYDATKVPCTPYDPKHAKKLVAESGFPNPTVHLLTPNTTDRLRLAQFIQAQEAAVGINVVIDSFDTATSTTRAESGSFDTYLSGFQPGGPEPNGMIYQFVATPGIRNYSGYSNPRLDLILANGLKASDPKARFTLYRVAQQIIADDRPIIPLYNPITFAAFSSDVAGVQLTPSAGLDVIHARFK